MVYTYKKDLKGLPEMRTVSSYSVYRVNMAEVMYGMYHGFKLLHPER